MKMKKITQKILIYDLDDTLVDTSDVYYSARKEFLQILTKQGIPYDQGKDTFEKIDTDNIATFGHDPKRYKASMLGTYKIFCDKYQIAMSDKIVKDLEKCGDIITKKMPRLISDAVELLSWGQKNHRQVLFTRGTESLQTRKILYSGLSKFFDTVKIASSKNTDVLRNLLKEIGAERHNCWIVGDSIKSDINPAIELGVNCILYLYTHKSYVWQQEYNYKPEGYFYYTENLLEVKDIIERPGDFEKVNRVN